MTEFPILYSRTSKGAINTWQVSVDGCDVVCRWGQIDGKQQISRFRCEVKNEGRSNQTTAEEQAELEAASKHAAQLRKKYSPTLEAAAESEAITPMLAKNFPDHKKKVKWPAYGQVKLDGLRALAHLKDGKVVLQSRGNKFYTLPHIQKQLESILKTNTVLDGELYTHGISLQTINSYVRGQKPECGVIEYHVYDVVSDKPFSGRLEDLNALKTRNSFDSMDVIAVDTVRLNSEEEAIAYQAKCVQDGYEGAMIRTATGIYRYGYRSPDLLKMKTFVDDEFKIVGWQAGKGRFEFVPTFKCVTKTGQAFDVTPKGTEEERLEMLREANSAIGKLLTVKYFMLSPDSQVPLYPVGLNIRDDIDP